MVGSTLHDRSKRPPRRRRTSHSRDLYIRYPALDFLTPIATAFWAIVKYATITCVLTFSIFWLMKGPLNYFSAASTAERVNATNVNVAGLDNSHVELTTQISTLPGSVEAPGAAALPATLSTDSESPQVEESDLFTVDEHDPFARIVVRDHSASFWARSLDDTADTINSGTELTTIGVHQDWYLAKIKSSGAVGYVHRSKIVHAALR